MPHPRFRPRILMIAVAGGFSFTALGSLGIAIFALPQAWFLVLISGGLALLLGLFATGPSQQVPDSPMTPVRRPLMTTRRLMVLVALVAATIGGCRTLNLVSRSYYYRQCAKVYRANATEIRKQATDPKTSPELAANYRIMADSLENLALRLECAADRPWLWDSRDPHQPK